MSEMEDRALRAAFAQAAEPADDAFVRGVMSRVDGARRDSRVVQALAVFCLLLMAAVFAPWIGRLAQRGVLLMQIAFSEPTYVTSLLAGGFAVLLATGFAVWSSRS